MAKLLLRASAQRLLVLLSFCLTWAVAAQAQAPAWKSALNVSDNTAATINSSSMTASATDGNGNVYVTGDFSGTLKLGSTTLVSSATRDIFVAKYNVASSQYVWVVQGGGTGDKEPLGIAVSGSNVYVTGDFSGTAASFGSITLSGASSSDIFIAKLTDAGTSASFTWAYRAGGSGSEFGNAIVASGNSVYIAGNFDSSQISFGSTVLTLAGGEDSFLAKLTDAGSSANFTWVQQWGGPGVDGAFSLAVSGSALYVGGPFTLACPFGSTTLTSAGGQDGYVAKFVDAGSSTSLGWVRQVGGSGNEVVWAVAASGSTVYVGGSFSTPMLAVGSTTLTSAGGDDAMLVKLTDAGSLNSVAWALRGGGTNGEIIYALAASGSDLYAAGIFNGASGGTLAAATFGTTTLQPAGYTDALLLKVSDGGSTGRFTWVNQAGGSNDYDNAYGLSVAGNTVVTVGYYYSSSISFGPLTLTNPYSSVGNSYGYVATTSTTVLATQAARPLPAEALYPNPARSSVTVQVPEAAGPAALSLRDALGRTVRQASASAGRPYTLDLAGLAPGLYVVQVQAGETLATRQLLVE